MSSLQTRVHPAPRSTGTFFVLAVLFVQMGVLGQACICPMPMGAHGEGDGSGMVGMAMGTNKDATDAAPDQTQDEQEQDHAPGSSCKFGGCCFADLTFLSPLPADTPASHEATARVPISTPSSVETDLSFFLIPEAIPPPTRSSYPDPHDETRL